MIKDKVGNTLYRQGDIIKLHLASEPHPRKLGKIDEVNKKLIVERNSTKHIFHKLNAYGFNYDLLNTATKFTHVELKITDLKKKYFVPIEEIITKGQFLNFKGQGFEVQIFLSLTIIEQYIL